MKRIKQIILSIIVVFTMSFGLNVNGQQEVNHYSLKLCTGIDSQGNLFNGAQCKGLQENGPCDKESVCYNDDDINQY